MAWKSLSCSRSWSGSEWTYWWGITFGCLSSLLSWIVVDISDRELSYLLSDAVYLRFFHVTFGNKLFSVLFEICIYDILLHYLPNDISLIWIMSWLFLTVNLTVNLQKWYFYGCLFNPWLSFFSNPYLLSWMPYGYPNVSNMEKFFRVVKYMFWLSRINE